MDKRKQQLLSEKRKSAKNERKKADNYLYKVFVVSVFFGIVNWLFWYVRFIDEDFRYYLVFVFFPIVLGMGFFYFKAKAFVDYYWDATNFLDKLLTRSFLLIIGIMISYVSFGTIANIIFKLLLITSSNNSNTAVHSYPIIQFIHTTKGSKRNYFNRFSTVHYRYGKNKERTFELENYSFLDEKRNGLKNKMDELSEEQVISKKLILNTKYAFWNIRYVADYTIE